MSDMSIQAERHLFGSFDGYRTLKQSPGIRPDEAAELSEFGFGQASDPTVLATLHERLCVLGRPLRSGRIAITRVFTGPPDDAGRPTIRLCSLVLEPYAFHQIRADLRAVFSEASVWSVSGFEQGVPASLRGQNRRMKVMPDVAHLVDWWMEMKGRRDLILSLPLDARSEEAIFAAVACVSDLDAVTLRWGLYLFSSAAAADVCTLAPFASRSMRRRIHELSLDAPWRHDRLASIASASIGHGTLPSFTELESAEFEIEAGPATVRRSRMAGRSVASGTPGRNLLPIAAVAAVILLLAGVVSMLLFSGGDPGPGPSQLAMRDAPTGSASGESVNIVASADPPQEEQLPQTNPRQEGQGSSDKPSPEPDKVPAPA
ncbi:hypothetical protein OAR33_00675, partial [bacterium]|nr:hypothetical protein [bacterium]